MRIIAFLLIAFSAYGSYMPPRVYEPNYYYVQQTTDGGFPATDGAGGVVYHDTMWRFGGWNPAFGDTPTISSVYSSVGGTWTLRMTAPWEQRHMAAFVILDDTIYMIGGDYSLAHYQNEVWKSGNPAHEWELVDTFSFLNRVGIGAGVIDNTVFVYGGQKRNPNTLYADLWKSTDGCRSFTLVNDSCSLPPHGYSIGSPTLNNNLLYWVAGGTYNDTVANRLYYDEVYSLGVNDTDFTLVSSAEIFPIEYNSVVLNNGILLTLCGYDGNNQNYTSWTNDYGVNWNLVGTPAITARHATTAYSYNGIIYVCGGSTDAGPQKDVWIIYEVTVR